MYDESWLTKEEIMGMIIRLSSDLTEESANISYNLMTTGKYDKEDMYSLSILKTRLKLYMKLFGFNTNEIDESVNFFQDMGVELSFSDVLREMDRETIENRLNMLKRTDDPQIKPFVNKLSELLIRIPSHKQKIWIGH